MIRIELPLPPSANALWIAVPRRNGTSARVTSPAYSRWQWSAMVAIREQNPEHVANGPYTVEIAVPDGRRRDVDNVCKPILDALVKHSITPDDRHCVRLVAEKRDDVPDGMCLVTVEAA